MRTLTVQVVGRTPLILHHISKHQLRMQIASSGESVTIEEEALKVMAKDHDGNPAIPVSWLWDAIRTGCSRIIVGGKQTSFVRLQSEICLPAEYLSLLGTDNNVPPWTVYTSMQHKAPGSKGSIAVVAPIFRDWRLEFNMSVQPSTDITLLEKVFLEAGKVGIGLFHPPKKQFGQFKTTIRPSR